MPTRDLASERDSTMPLFASCAPGLETMLLNEIRGLELGENAVSEPGGVSFSGTRSDMMRANLCLGLALHVLVRIATFPARHLQRLERECGKIDWSRWLPSDACLRIRAHSRRSRLYHTGAIVQRVRGGLARSINEREPGVDGEFIPLQVRLHRDVCTISIGTSGKSLYKRGWKEAVVKSPLREDLARALLIASGWRPGMVLVDPLMGSGTIVIEAARWARGLAPGLDRRFSFMDGPLHDESTFAKLRQRCLDESVPSSENLAPIHGSDRDTGAVAIAEANATRAGVAADLRISHCALSRVELPLAKQGVIVTNPPYGRRVGTPKTLRNLYSALGAQVRGQGSWKIGLLSDDPRLAAATGLRLRSQFMTDLGGLKVRAFIGPVDDSEETPI